MKLPGETLGAPVKRIRNLIGNLDLGKSVAEFDEALETYFIETNAFRELISDKIDIIAGDKGTGKTAIYRILHKKYPTLPSLHATEVLAAFNPIGNPVFQKLGEHAVQEEGEYIRMWKLTSSHSSATGCSACGMEISPHRCRSSISS